jgi:hypothetical protein
MLEDALGGHDWARYAGPGSAVRIRGERRRRRRRSTALGVAAMTTAVGVAVPTLGPRILRQDQNAAAHAPGVPILPEGTSRVLASGVLGEGYVRGVFWQVAWETIPNPSSTDSSPTQSCRVLTVGESTGKAWCTEGSGPIHPPAGFTIENPAFQLKLTTPLLVAAGTTAPGTVSLTARWHDGRSQPVSLDDLGRAAVAFAPDDPPATLVEQGSYGTRTLTVTRKPQNETFVTDNGHMVQVQPASPPVVQPLISPAPLATDPGGKTLYSGTLGQGTAGGHTWELAYRVVPSGSTANTSPFVTCEDLTVDGVSHKEGCSSGDGHASPHTSHPTPVFAFGPAPESPVPLLLDTVWVDDQTTAVGLQWADGTQTVTAVAPYGGNSRAAVGFDPAKPPAYILLIGSYGEKKLPVISRSSTIWEVK